MDDSRREVIGKAGSPPPIKLAPYNYNSTFFSNKHLNPII